MVLGGCPVSYLLLCGQAALLLGNLLLLHCVSRSHSHNATAEPELTSAGAAHPEGYAGAPSWEYGDPQSPVILCSYLPDEFIECDDPVDHVGNATASQELGYGCLKFGGQAYSDVEHTSVQCRALDGIECASPRTFLRENKPCIKHCTGCCQRTRLAKLGRPRKRKKKGVHQSKRMRLLTEQSVN
ncbi:TM2 domain-containing protein 2 isoform X2 [Panthera uncia]|uniref:TM2 domain-containing protein 2 isoform X2 n=1 Tax=Panthera uncia TaxID=29064 RepID=UPI0020FF9CB1|nr:TM2 domain-containing protein 2 isoform X2 [Panthera uncia]